MKHILSAFAACVLLGAGTAAFAQRNMEKTQVLVSAQGNKLGALVQLPDDYKTGNTKYPLLMVFHGKSKAGDDLSKLIIDGLPYWLDKGVKLDAKNPVDKKIYKFIIVMPQSHSFGLRPREVENVLNDVMKRYRVDPARVYLTGYSAGGWVSLMSITEKPELSKRIAAIVSLSPTSLEDKNVKQFKMIADANVPVWFLAGRREPHFMETAQKYTDSVNKYKKGLARVTVHENKHCCFKDIYDPHYRPFGLNVYEWLLQHTRK